MLGTCFHSDKLQLWGRLDANRYNRAPEEVQQNILDAVSGVNGAKVCRDLAAKASESKQDMNNYVHKYARVVNRSKTSVKEGYELSLINQEEIDANYAAKNTVMEFTVGYFEDKFDQILNADALDTLMHEFSLVRKHIMYETNSDLAVIMMNVAANNENAACAKTALYRLCEEYELRDFFTMLLTCEGSFDRIVQIACN